MKKIKVLIVDDSLFMREVISQLLEPDPQIEVVGTAPNGLAALKSIDELKPDVVTLDYEMPKLNGLETLNKIMESPTPPSVIILSGYTTEESDITLECLRAGAIDFVKKPSGTLSIDMYKISDLLIEKIKTAAQTTPFNYFKQKTLQKEDKKLIYKRESEGALVIGASTGGPSALEILLKKIPADFPLPIFIAQHLPRSFTKTFAKRLNQECEIDILEAYDGLKVERSKVYIAPGGLNMEVVGNIQDLHPDVRIKISKNITHTETPSINTLMVSVAKVYKENTIGIILTGMGKDGALGMEVIKNHGGATIVQDEESSVIFGMGKEVIAKGVGDNILPLEKIHNKVSELLISHDG